MHTTSVLALLLLSLAAHAAPIPQPLLIGVNAVNRAPGGIYCQATQRVAGPIVALAFSPDGKTLASGGYQEVLLWDLANPRLAKRIPATGAVGAVAFLKDGTTLAIGEGQPGQSGAVRLVEIATGKEIARFNEPKDLVCSLALSPDGTLLAAGGDKVAHVWNVAEKKRVTTLQGHTARILNVSFGVGGKYLTTTSADKTAQVFAVADWSVAARFTEAHAVRGSILLPGDEVLVWLPIGGPEGSGLRQRKVESPTFRRTLALTTVVPMGIAGPTKASRMFVPCADRSIRVYDSRNANQVASLLGHTDWVHTVAVSPDESKFASGSADGTIKIWNVADNRLLATATQLSPRSDEWLILSPSGYLATSVPDTLLWRADKPSTTIDDLSTTLLNPQLLAKILAGEKVPSATIK